MPPRIRDHDSAPPIDLLQFAPENGGISIGEEHFRQQNPEAAQRLLEQRARQEEERRQRELEEQARREEEQQQERLRQEEERKRLEMEEMEERHKALMEQLRFHQSPGTYAREEEERLERAVAEMEIILAEHDKKVAEEQKQREQQQQQQQRQQPLPQTPPRQIAQPLVQQPQQQLVQPPSQQQQWQQWSPWQLRRHELQPRYPAFVMRRVAANVTSVQAAYNQLIAIRKPSTPERPVMLPDNDPSVIWEREATWEMKAILEHLAVNWTESGVPIIGFPPPQPGILSVHQMFHILRCTPPKVGSIIPNSERCIWYRSFANEYAELNYFVGGLLKLIEPYLNGEAGYEDSPDALANGSGAVRWREDLQVEWCTCHYDSFSTRFVTRQGNAEGALVVGYRTPWNPVCQGCRGMRSVEIMALDYLARWFSFPVPAGTHILDVMEAWAEAEQIQQKGGDVPETPNGPSAESEGRSKIDLSTRSKLLSRKVQGLLWGERALMRAIEEASSPTRKSKRRREDDGGEEAGENNTRPRVVQPMPKRRRLPDGPSSAGPSVDAPSANASVAASNQITGSGDVEMMDVWGDDPAASAAPVFQNTAPSVVTAPQQAPQGQLQYPPLVPPQVQIPQLQYAQPQPPQAQVPQVEPAEPQVEQQQEYIIDAQGIKWAPRLSRQQPVEQAVEQFVEQPVQQFQGINPGAIAPRATAAEAQAILAAEGREYPEEPEDVEAYCNCCKNKRMKQAGRAGNKKCQKCIDTDTKIRNLNFERGYCTRWHCKTYMGLPRPTKGFGEPYALCLSCREKSNRQKANRRERLAQEAAQQAAQQAAQSGGAGDDGAGMESSMM